MIFVDSNVKDWTLKEGQIYETPEGFEVRQEQMNDICKYYGVPATLINVDKKYNTTTLKEVLHVAAPKVSFVAEEGNIQVLDPKSRFVSDDEFNQAIEIVQQSGNEGHFIDRGLTKSFVVEIPQTDNDVFCGDVFKKSAKLTRLPQGGLQIQSDLLRLACTNGMTIPDSQFRLFLRNGAFDGTVSNSFLSTLGDLSLKDYFERLFNKDGVPVFASVADYLGMHDTLQKITDSEDIANLLFPEEGIKDFYESQNIKIESISRQNLQKLPSGLNYYQCFNILTNGAKSAEKTIENEIAVAAWCKPSRMRQLQQSSLMYEGMPMFSPQVIKERMGDI